jgi:hypothetical protein
MVDHEDERVDALRHQASSQVGRRTVELPD